MNYLLDAAACIARCSITTRPSCGNAFGKPWKAAHASWFPPCRSTNCGTAWRKFRRPNKCRTANVQTFLAGSIELLAFDDDDARMTGFVRAGLEAAGVHMGAYDVQVAGQAVLRKLILVTVNVPEYGYVDKLEWEDWSQPPTAST